MRQIGIGEEWLVARAFYTPDQPLVADQGAGAFERSIQRRASDPRYAGTALMAARTAIMRKRHRRWPDLMQHTPE